MIRTISRLCVVVIIAVSVVTGCTPTVKRPKTIPVTGTVVYNSQPVANATVSFWAEKSSRASSGVTNEKGEFVLSTYAYNDGALEGVNKITVTKADPKSESVKSDPTKLMNDPAAMAKMSEEMIARKNTSNEKPPIPLKYASLNTTDLSETIKDGQLPVVVTLKD